MAWHLLHIMKEHFLSKKIEINNPLDLIRWVIKYVKPRNIDKTLANLGGISCLPKDAVSAARRGSLAQYTVRSRFMWRQTKCLKQYEISWDPGNEVYANWLFVISGESFPELKRSLENSEQREVMADMAEAALGVCQAAERVPAVQAFSRLIFRTSGVVSKTR